MDDGVAEGCVEVEVDADITMAVNSMQPPEGVNLIAFDMKLVKT